MVNNPIFSYIGKMLRNGKCLTLSYFLLLFCTLDILELCCVDIIRLVNIVEDSSFMLYI